MCAFHYRGNMLPWAHPRNMGPEIAEEAEEGAGSEAVAATAMEYSKASASEII